MKRSLIIIFILLLLSFTYFFMMSGDGVSYEESNSLTLISPFSNDLSQLSRLYYINVDNLVSEMRTIKVEMLETELAVLKALQKGSKVETYTAPIDESVQILSVETLDRICYVNLSSEFLADNDNLYLRVMAIVNSLVEFESIDFVQVLTEGKKIQNNPDKLGNPLSKNTSLLQDIELDHKETMKKFLEYITQGRYDLAYDLVDSESKKDATFTDFKESAAVIRNEIKGYTLGYIFAKREQGRFVIQVKYVLRDSPRSNELLLNEDIPEDIPFSWPMIQEEYTWKIKYFGN